MSDIRHQFKEAGVGEPRLAVLSHYEVSFTPSSDLIGFSIKETLIRKRMWEDFCIFFSYFIYFFVLFCFVFEYLTMTPDPRESQPSK